MYGKWAEKLIQQALEFARKVLADLALNELEPQFLDFLDRPSNHRFENKINDISTETNEINVLRPTLTEEDGVTPPKYLSDHDIRWLSKMEAHLRLYLKTTEHEDGN
jgi:hypothetical protein